MTTGADQLLFDRHRGVRQGPLRAPSPPRDNEVFGMDDPSPIMGIGSYLVDDSQKAGTFVRHGRAEWAEFSRTGPAFETRFPTNNVYDEVTEGPPSAPVSSFQLKVREMNYDLDLTPAFINTIPTEEESNCSRSLRCVPPPLLPSRQRVRRIRGHRLAGRCRWTREFCLFFSDFTEVSAPLPGPPIRLVLLGAHAHGEGSHAD